MRYKTIVEKNEDGLEEIIGAVQQFEEDRFLASLSVRRYTIYDIRQMAMTVREYQTKMNRELLALDHFAETKMKRNAKSLSTYAQENYHKFDTTSFKMSVLAEAVRQGRDNGLTDDEARLWPNDHDRALLVRHAIEQLDNLEGAEGQKGKLNGNLMVEFVKWCGVQKGMEKNMYETYFLKTYKGRLKALSWSTICKVRKEREEMGISDDEERGSFENRLDKMMKVA